MEIVKIIRSKISLNKNATKFGIADLERFEFFRLECCDITGLPLCAEPASSPRNLQCLQCINILTEGKLSIGVLWPNQLLTITYLCFIL